MNGKDLFTWIVFGTLFGFLAYLGLASSRANKEGAAEKVKKDAEACRLAEAARQEELAFISDAANLLPNGEAALAHLKTRFAWSVILQSASVHELHIKLLQAADFKPNLELPSLHIADKSSLEFAAIRAATAVANRLQDRDFRFGQITSGPPIETYQQEPTVSTLMELTARKLAEASPEPSHECRSYTVNISSSGSQLLYFNGKFGDRQSNLPLLLNLPKCNEARLEIGRLLFRALVERLPSEPGHAFTAFQQGTLLHHALRNLRAGSHLQILALLALPTVDDPSEAWLQDYPAELQISRIEAAAALEKAKAT